MFPRMCRNPPWMNMEVSIEEAVQPIRHNSIVSDEVIQRLPLPRLSS